MIHIKQLSKRFAHINALQDVNLDVAAGCTAVIQGPSGSGKSTLLRLVAGLEIPDEGQIDLHGQLASTPGFLLPPYQRHLGMLFQTNALWPHMNIYQNIAFGLNGLDKRQIVERTQQMMAAMEIPELAKRFPSQLSGGQARRVALARTLVTQPKILLLDEPLINLNPELKIRLLEWIIGYAQNNKATMLYVTHDPVEALRIPAERYTIIEGQLHAG
jgi:ABC-type Fe3+/spermidine/putrescine transport system ATPase subunit